MIITKIRISNFGPFKGKQVFSPSYGVNNSLTLVFGDNMRGKTSLFNALKWVLYGEVYDRHKELINPADFLNKESKSEGNRDFWIELEFINEGSNYRLRRTATVNEDIGLATEASVESKTILSRDNVAQSESHLNRLIERIMPSLVSRFYLFDGEVLGDYELLLREGDNQGQRIAKAIENILGVPAVLNAKSDLESIKKDFLKIVSMQRGHDKEVDGWKVRLEDLISQQDSLEKDRVDLSTQLDSHVIGLRAVEAKLKRFTEIESENKHLRLIEEELRDVNQRLERCRRERADAAGSLWLHVLQDVIFEKCKELERVENETKKKINSYLEEEFTVKILQQALDSSACSLCNKELDPHTKAVLSTRINDLTTKASSDIQVQRQRVSDIRNKLSIMNAARHQSLAAGGALNVEKDISRLTKRQLVLTSKRADLEDLLRGHDLKEISKLQADRDRHVEMKTLLSDRLNKIDNELALCEANIDKMSQRIEESKQVESTEASDLLMLSRGLVNLFGASVEKLRSRLRSEVEREASEAFISMTSEKTFSELRINKNYGLSIIDRQGDPQPLQSAGAAQVVAMSLIIALNRCSGKDAPLFVDTPFGRLDPIHRKNILAHLPSVAKQVVLLVQEGELSRERDLDVVQSVTGAIYALDRITSSHTRIRELP